MFRRIFIIPFSQNSQLTDVILACLHIEVSIEHGAAISLYV